MFELNTLTIMGELLLFYLYFQSYQSLQTNEEACHYHSGVPIFHEGYVFGMF